MAGLSIPDELDGKSLKPLLDDRLVALTNPNGVMLQLFGEKETHIFMVNLQYFMCLVVDER